MSSLEPRFWSKVDKLDQHECWYWKASIDINGYGQFLVNKGQLGNKTTTMAKAHRVAWMLTHGDIPKGMYLCHTCDMPSCVNPTHLFLGTQKDNMQDCVAKKRHGYGTVGLPLVYTVEKRKRIFEAYKNGTRIEDITDRFGISRSHLLRLLKQSKIPLRDQHVNNRKLTSIQVQQIRELYAIGNISQYELAARFKVTPTNIGCIILGKSWPEMPLYNHPKRKVRATLTQANEMKELWATGTVTLKELAQRFQFGKTTVWDLLNDVRTPKQ